VPTGPTDPDDVREYCNRGCGTMVRHRDQGKPHSASETVDGEIVIFTCDD